MHLGPGPHRGSTEVQNKTAHYIEAHISDKPIMKNVLSLFVWGDSCTVEQGCSQQHAQYSAVPTLKELMEVHRLM